MKKEEDEEEGRVGNGMGESEGRDAVEREESK